MIVSSIEGRIRFSDENIKNPEKADKIMNTLKDQGGIENIRINGVIGTLLINYNKEKITLIQILDILKEYIDIREKPKDNISEDTGYINKAVDIVKNNLKREKYS